MANRKRTMTVPDAARKQAIASLQQYFAGSMDEPIGELKAGLLFDFMLSEIGPTIYNQAIADARAFFEERTSDLGAICYFDEFPTSRKK